MDRKGRYLLVMKQLSLFRRIVFVDWHGVASRDPFWYSILSSKSHPAKAKLRADLDYVFGRSGIVDSWMRGCLSSEEVISLFRTNGKQKFGNQFLENRLRRDCARMLTNASLLRTLARLRPMIPIIVATDNMDCFTRAFERARSRPGPNPSDREGAPLREWARICDGLLCSSEIGVLKAEDPTEFFGPTLEAYGLAFEDALLIDDRRDNCDAFQREGGAAVQWKAEIDDVQYLADQIYAWLGWRNPPVNRPTERTIAVPGA